MMKAGAAASLRTHYFQITVNNSFAVKVLEAKSHTVYLRFCNSAKRKGPLGKKYQLLSRCRGVISKVTSKVPERAKRGE
jgi:hypothetical protein